MQLKYKILLGLLIAFVAIQFIQPALNNEAAAADSDIATLYAIPADVTQILQLSCYDCHSNKTEYPWYARIQPAAYFMASHIKEGKDHVNFSEFGTYSRRRQRTKFMEMESTIRAGDMPISSYTIIHRGAKLTAAKKAILLDWIEENK